MTRSPWAGSRSTATASGTRPSTRTSPGCATPASCSRTGVFHPGNADRHDPLIYPGQYVTCIYNPDRALCHRRDGTDGPSLPDCQPLACRNVALTSPNIAALTHHQTELDQALQPRDVLAPYVRYRLEEQLAEVSAFLASYDLPHPGQA